MIAPRASKSKPKAFSFESLRNQTVEVIASGILYQGVLVGADETDLYVKGVLRWLILPLDTVSSVRLPGQKKTLDPRKAVDASFYSLVNRE